MPAGAGTRACSAGYGAAVFPPGTTFTVHDRHSDGGVDTIVLVETPGRGGGAGAAGGCAPGHPPGGAGTE